MRRALAVALVLVLTAGTLLVGAGSGRAGPAATPAAAPPVAAIHPPDPSAAGHVAAKPHSATGADLARGRTSVTGALARFPHPSPPRPAPAQYSGHYYAGTYYTGSNFTSHQLSATIQIPLDVAGSQDFYYVILSLWDNASSYDQIGFANSGGVFGIAYSTTSTCAGYYYYSPDAYPLTPGLTYNFSMSISAGTVFFVVSYLNGTPVWTLNQGTGGFYFVEAPFYSCFFSAYNITITAYDYTDYEEVYNTANNVPPYDFFFGANLADDLPVGNFSVFETPPLPGPVTVPINGDNAVVANEPFNVYLNQANSTFALESPATSKSFTIDLGVADVNLSGAVELGTYSLPSGWGVSFSQSTGNPPFTYSALVTVPAYTGVNNYTVGFNATDSSGNPNEITVWFNIVPPITVAVQVGPRSVADLGQNVTISAVPGGGVGGLSYAWSGLPPGCTGAVQTIRCQPSTTGNYLISVTATDSEGDVGVAPVFSLAVHPDPVVTLVASPSRVDVNLSVEFYATGLSGSGGFSYSWPGLLAGCTAVGSIATCVFPSAGARTMSAVATDAAAYSVTSAGATVQVLASPQIALALSTKTVDVHQPVLFAATATGGAGGFTYEWTGLPSGCASTAPVANCSFGSTGSFLVTVSALDSFEVATPLARAYVTVSSDPVVVFSASTPSVDLGQTAKFDVRVSGGAPGYSYDYLHLPAGCSSTNVVQLACLPTATASYANFSVAVTDRNDWTVDASINFTVYADPTAALSATPAQVTVGNSVRFAAAVTGGAPGDAYSWQNLPGGCQAVPSATIACAPSGTGTTTVTVVVTDGDGFVVNASATISVVAAPSGLAGSGTLLVVGLTVVAVAVVAVVASVLWSRRRNRPPPEE